MGDRIDPETRLFTIGKREIEPVKVVRNVRENRLQFGNEHFEPHELRLAHFDDDVITFGSGIANLAHGGAQR
ncbi:hypothetical protein GCM10010136_08180 [Limoniibacter endophyticus]|uniref:Uncharacterized protein n=1 Tax=Limoniibacter endophyticus TaxID=1565040 RepID=A0A8J3DF84_9HYPH|nr:hypothetical protein GCM10010136_08180 [Limoniibacter endophyticus]